MLAPRLGPVAVGERGDGGGGRRDETERAERCQVVPDARLQRRRSHDVGEKGAQRGAPPRTLLLDDPERALLPEEIRERFGGVVVDGEGQLPVARWRGDGTTRGASSSARGTTRAADCPAPWTRLRRPPAPRAGGR